MRSITLIANFPFICSLSYLLKISLNVHSEKQYCFFLFDTKDEGIIQIRLESFQQFFSRIELMQNLEGTSFPYLLKIEQAFFHCKSSRIKTKI